MTEPLIPKHGGYRHLKSFQVSEVIYDLTVRFCDRIVGQLPMDFLHNGLPRRRMQAVYQDPPAESGAGRHVANVTCGSGRGRQTRR